MQNNTMECTCYKPQINGKCEVCREWYAYQASLFGEVRELIQKYPNEVQEIINCGTKGNAD